MYTLIMSNTTKNKNSKNQLLPVKVLIDANLKKEGYVMCGHKVIKLKSGKLKWKKISNFTPKCWAGIKSARNKK